jgi:hypothetical protein
MGLFDNLFGKRHNVERGKDVQDEWRMNQDIQGNSYKRRAVGSDYERTVTDPYTGKKHTERWEMKRNNSPLSKRQKQTRGLKVYRSIDTPLGSKVRIENKNGEELERNLFTGKYNKVPKRDSDPFGLNALGGSSSSKPRRSKANDDPFGVGSMLGSGSGSSKRKRKNDNPFGW